MSSWTCWEPATNFCSTSRSRDICSPPPDTQLGILFAINRDSNYMIWSIIEYVIICITNNYCIIRTYLLIYHLHVSFLFVFCYSFSSYEVRITLSYFGKCQIWSPPPAGSACSLPSHWCETKMVNIPGCQVWSKPFCFSTWWGSGTPFIFRKS